jgi:two-component system phosphate regulon sensor histidine kinase PhoR
MSGPLKLAFALALYLAALVVLLAFGQSPWLLIAVGSVPLIIVAVMCIAEAREATRESADLRRRLTEAERRAERLGADLSRADARLRALDEPVLIVDPAGTIAACNPAAESLLELRADRLRGRPPEEAFTHADLLALYERARSGEPLREQVRITRASGMRVWDVSAIPLTDPTGGPAGVLVCLRDATDAALALKVRADFVANASHELRTPIAAMRIAMDTLGTLEEGDDAMRRRLDGVIAANVARLEDMARDLLDLSRLETDEGQTPLEPVSLKDLARELAAAFEPTCSARRLTLAFDIAPDAERIQSSHRLLTLVLGNLIDNAAKFAFEGTEIRVVARAAPADGIVRLDVIDRGIGIPLDQQQRIFERFYQVDPARTQGRRGTGLGLAIVKHAVRALGGTIRVQSVWQQGTTMTVELPAPSADPG